MAKVQTRFRRRAPGHFIRQWRQQRGYTLEQLAEMVGVTHGALSQLERGLTNYTQPMLENLAEALRCEPADLIMRNPDDQDAVWSILDNLRHAPPALRGQIAAVADALIRKTGTGE